VGPTAVPLRKRLTASSKLCLLFAVPLALAGLAVYGLLFLFNAGEQLTIAVCFGIPFIGMFATCWLPDSSVRWLRLGPFSLVAVSVAVDLLRHPHSASVPAPVVFGLAACGAVLAGTLGGLITGAALDKS